MAWKLNTVVEEPKMEIQRNPYVNGFIHGTVITHDMSTSLWDGSKSRETPYLYGKKHGTQISYRDGSKTSETPYVNGKRAWHAN